MGRRSPIRQLHTPERFASSDSVNHIIADLEQSAPEGVSSTRALLRWSCLQSAEPHCRLPKKANAYFSIFNDRPISWTHRPSQPWGAITSPTNRGDDTSSHTRSSLSKLPSIQRSHFNPLLPVALHDEDVLHTCSLIVSPGPHRYSPGSNASVRHAVSVSPELESTSMQYAKIIRHKLNPCFNY